MSGKILSDPSISYEIKHPVRGVDIYLGEFPLEVQTNVTKGTPDIVILPGYGQSGRIVGRLILPTLTNHDIGAAVVNFPFSKARDLRPIGPTSLLLERIIREAPITLAEDMRDRYGIPLGEMAVLSQSAGTAIIGASMQDTHEHVGRLVSVSGFGLSTNEGPVAPSTKKFFDRFAWATAFHLNPFQHGMPTASLSLLREMSRDIRARTLADQLALANRINVVRHIAEHATHNQVAVIIGAKDRLITARKVAEGLEVACEQLGVEFITSEVDSLDREDMLSAAAGRLLVWRLLGLKHTNLGIKDSKKILVASAQALAAR